jgi:hypothetical protein
MKCRDVGNCRNMLYPSPTNYELVQIEVDLLYCFYGQKRLQVRESGRVEVLIHPSLFISMKIVIWGNTRRPPYVLPLFQALVGVSLDLRFPIYQADNELDLPRNIGEASSFLLSNSTTWVGVGKVYTVFYLSLQPGFGYRHTRSE